MIWPHATKQDPCQVCGATDWCTFGDRAMLCQRIASEHAHPKGGWYHFYDGNIDTTKFPKAKEAPKPINATVIMRNYRLTTNEPMISGLAQKLGVAQHALETLGVAWSVTHKAWAFPMSNGDGEAVGVRLRNDSGDKWAVTGSRQGVFLPQLSDSIEDDFVMLPEGPTSTAAFLTMGFFAIGRPNVKTGCEDIQIAMRRLGFKKAVIVADNDKLKRLGNRFGHPGIEGAVELKKKLGFNSIIWNTTGDLKDGRDYLLAGGTRKMIMAEIRNKLWTKL